MSPYNWLGLIFVIETKDNRKMISALIINKISNKACKNSYSEYHIGK